jgi:hypothetical protein
MCLYQGLFASDWTSEICTERDDTRTQKISRFTCTNVGTRLLSHASPATLSLSQPWVAWDSLVASRSPWLLFRLLFTSPAAMALTAHT